jgi:hypothetical protein
MTIPRCLCCNRTLDDPSHAIYGWCSWCAGGVLHEVLCLRDGPPAVVGVRVAALRDWHADAIATAIVGPLPFETRPSAAELERLTDE